MYRYPQDIFKKLNSLLLKFIWNNGNDRVKRELMYNQYEEGGLKMADTLLYSRAQKMILVKHFFDENF